MDYYAANLGVSSPAPGALPQGETFGARGTAEFEEV
jgi:hypothetical protein